MIVDYFGLEQRLSTKEKQGEREIFACYITSFDDEGRVSLGCATAR